MTPPRATYRLQLHAGFTLADATRRVPYLARLGISHVYSSPLLQARPGSLHGYDVIDPTRLNPELGTEADLQALSAALHQHGMGLLLDIVPNHMGVLEAANPWWLDVLANGPASPHAQAFDIEWQPPQRELHGKVLLPVLGQGYGAALEAGEIVPAFEPTRGAFELRYWNHRFPIDPRDHAALLRGEPLPTQATPAQRAQIESLITAFGRLPSRHEPAARTLRQREAQALHDALRALHDEFAWARVWLQACAEALQGRVGEPASFDALDQLMQRQAWRLAHWRAANDQVNYRRFFDVNALAALRMEAPGVFEAAHAHVLQWMRQGRVQALRIDHPDGLADPQAYFDELQRHTGGVYVVAEKIVAEDEAWPTEWPVQGDTGYRFSNQVQGVFVDAQHGAAFTELTAEFTGSEADFDAELEAAKRTIMQVSLAADLRLLTEMAREIALQDRHTRDLTRRGLEEALLAYGAAFDVYRSYVSARGVPAACRARIERAVAKARAAARPSLSPYLDFLRDVMLHAPEQTDPERRAAMLRFVQRLQQFTAPVMAKAMEDTAFYRFHRLVSLNDVGGDPRRFGMSPEDFHAANERRSRCTPHTLLAGSTHDSKRSEDLRARLNVLSEQPARWRDALLHWRALAQAQWRIGGLELQPTAGDELLLYQTLVGLWPGGAPDEAALAELRERVVAYMQKAVREAKQQTSWLDNDDTYEAALQRAVELLLARLEPNPFLSDLRRFADELAPFGRCNSLAVAALKLTSPGVPDVYQGNEDWSLALVDPDNRRPVDDVRLQAKLLRSESTWQRPPPLDSDDSPAKIALVQRVLQWRRTQPALFAEGAYLPLQATGPRAAHLLAFARVHAPAGAEPAYGITVVPRLVWQASGGDVRALGEGTPWQGCAIELPAELHAVPLWHDVLGGRTLQGGSSIDLAGLHRLPLAVLRPASAP